MVWKSWIVSNLYCFILEGSFANGHLKLSLNCTEARDGRQTTGNLCQQSIILWWLLSHSGLPRPEMRLSGWSFQLRRATLMGKTKWPIRDRHVVQEMPALGFWGRQKFMASEFPKKGIQRFPSWSSMIFLGVWGHPDGCSDVRQNCSVFMYQLSIEISTHRAVSRP